MGAKGVFNLRAEYNVPVRMRDGVRLSADVYRPDRKGRFPVLLSRTYYGKSREDLGDPSSKEFIEFFVTRGYVVVIQDCRGRYDSEGEFYPEIHDAKDGYDTIDWCARQPWSNGRVGMFGCSYLGCVQWYCAHLNNPHLKCIVPWDATSDPYFDGGFMRGGVLQVAALMKSLVNTAGKTDRANLLKTVNISEVYEQLPLRELDERLGFRFLFWRDYVDHPTYGDFWKRTSVHDKYHMIKVPSLNIGGWYSHSDVMGTIRNFVGVRTKGPSGTRKNHRLLIGPWAHCETVSKIGEIDFGPDARVDFLEIHRRWFDYWLRGRGEGMTTEAPVRLFVMGANKWRSAREWPLRTTRYVKYYLHSDGHANTLKGDGLLDQNPPRSEPPDGFTFDPANPAGMSLGHYEHRISLDQRPNERRDDVLVFSTPRLRAGVEVTGPVRLLLYASSSARDTDFTGKLVDVYPNDASIFLTCGIIRARFRESFEKPSPIKPGRVYRYDMDLWATSNLFKTDHRIRLEVSSSEFPMFMPNTNTGGDTGSETKTVVARQTIYHDTERPSHLLLPVIPRARK